MRARRAGDLPSFKSPIFRSGLLLAPLQKSTSSRSLQRTLGFRVGSTSTDSQCPDLVRYSFDSDRIAALRQQSIGANSDRCTAENSVANNRQVAVLQDALYLVGCICSKGMLSYVRSANAITHYGIVPGHSTGAPFARAEFSADHDALFGRVRVTRVESDSY
jgi:hypothetical protein